MRTPALVRSSALPYAGGNLTINNQFLLQSPIAMVAPEVRCLWLRISGLITFGGAATVAGKNLILELIQRVLITDPRGEVVSMSGASLRQWAQRAMGDAYQDPSTVTGGGAGDVAFDFSLPIPFEMRKFYIPEDFRKPTSDLAGPGSQIIIQLSSGTLTPSASTAVVKTTSTSVEMYAEISDAGSKRATSRLQLRDYVVPADDFRYEVQGLLVEAWYSVQASAIVAGTTAAARSYISDGLAYLQYPNTLLDLIYQSQLYSQDSTDDVKALFSQNIYAATNDQSVAELPDLAELQVRMSVAHETNSVICIAALTPRSPAQVAGALGVSQAALPAVAAAAASITTTENKPRSDLGTKMAAFLPMTSAVKSSAAK